MSFNLLNLANVIISGVLTGLVYGLMALGLSVIFGVARVVNFAHGEMMTIAMYLTAALFAGLNLDPFLAVLPVAAVFLVFGYALQATVINPFVTRPEHSQFMLLLAIAVIMTNALLIVFGPDARSIRLDYLLESIELGPLLIDRGAGRGLRRRCGMHDELASGCHARSWPGLHASRFRDRDRRGPRFDVWRAHRRRAHRCL